jgi:hypothetical protein
MEIAGEFNKESFCREAGLSGISIDKPDYLLFYSKIFLILIAADRVYFFTSKQLKKPQYFK